MAFRSLAVFALGTRVLLLDAKETKPKSCIKFDPNEGCHLLEEHQALRAVGQQELSMIQRARSKKEPNAGLERVGTEEVLAASPDTIEDPGTLQIIIMGGLVINGGLNQRYDERPGGSYVVAGQKTFWSSDGNGYYLYWCETFKYWTIGIPENWAMVKDSDGRSCSVIAMGPEGERALNSSSLSGGWSEYEAGQWVVRVAAGVQIVSTASGLGAGLGSFHISESMGEACVGQMLQLGARDQGTCGNCWANAVAQTLQSLLCDKVDFQGLRASVSVAYITSCASDAFVGKDGCSGGDPRKALIWIGSNGVPTGGDFGCMKPLVMNATPTQCPTSCSNEFYDRSLQEDLFVPAGLKNSWMTDVSENAKLWLHKGPVIIQFKAYSDFHDYTSGVYSPADDAEFSFYHICAAIAYGKDYFTAYNSWGSGSWGQGGLFNISADAIDHFIIPGEISGSATDYPIPLPPVEVADYVVMAGFETDFLNGKYIEGGAATVSGHPVFWNHHGSHGFPSPPNATVLFWCPSTGSWAIAWASHYPDELRIGRCHWLARGPALDSAAALASQPQVGGGWLESSEGGGSRGRVEALG